MNPSALGWIKKLFTVISKSSILQLNKGEFYSQLKDSGFIYGSNVDCIINDVIKVDAFNEEERCKVNLLSSFYYIHSVEQSELNFLDSVIGFYKSIDEHKRSFLADLFGQPSSDVLLEQIIHKRIHIDDNVITKNFNYFLINAFLFMDIIGYHHYLTTEESTKDYLTNFGAALETVLFTVLDSKADKTEYDKNLVKLFEASLGHKHSERKNSEEIAEIIKGPLEKLYVIDTVCMASWSDKHIDRAEYVYLNQLRQDLSIDTDVLIKAVDDINSFYEDHKDDISFLSAKNLAQSFYDNSSSIVVRLIKRNSKRLSKELSQSKEALILLSQSTKRNLTEEEQKKIQNQLLDIFKSIPSLAIFMLPGGMLLLPLFIKFIPKLLPSAFDENRIDD
ncbi:MAG: hypothetical protein ED556_05750 [Winogradskyella sp.]|uniref:LETM1-related biofilm-associated protein n=1 Tax=Winogradskyella sp. TaxID=1883156 RepID=UPI000F3DD0F8|nr:LETM1-related biofilm-associated protein [Winogradskyella sp.]RNC86927.1 MAG: hypothetical protein ED556_05750 [Winogradskyella sp.]